MRMPLISLAFALIVSPAFAQQMYKCPDSSGRVKYQQMPCSPTGGGESVTIKKIPKSGGDGLSEGAKSYLEEREKARRQSQASPPQRTARSGEFSAECMRMKRRIMRLEEREARGIHTWSRHGYEQSQYLSEEYEKLCGR